MIAELGAFALGLGLCLSLAQVGLAVAGRFRADRMLRGAGEGAALAAFAALAVAFAALTVAFVTSDFSVANVAANSHTDKPLFYKVTAVWGSHEGSMLLWCLCLTGFGAAVAITGRALPVGLKGWTVAVQGGLATLFLAYTVFASNPFLRLDPAPVEGRSLNPLLQDPALAVHPPMLYAGYVGFSVVFSFAAAALMEGKVDAAWARWVRPWALASWAFLTGGIALGSFWAYYELGWGGWWFWDPVENASFMPWLMGAALLHSAVVTERRGSLQAWTVLLALGAFTFSMLGAFLVRSGVLTSVHAFAVDPTRGALLLGIMGAAALFGFGLFAWRAPTFKPGGVFAPVSREASLVLNNLFVCTATLTVLWGTLYPLVAEALGRQVSVGPPWFNLTFVPLMAVGLLILPVAILTPWKRGDLKGVFQRLTWAGAAAILAAVAAVGLFDATKPFALIGVGLATWLIAGALAEAAERVRLGRAPLAESVRRAGGLPRGAWGATLAHVGVGVFILGACVETAWKLEAARPLPLGGTLDVGAFSVRLDSAGLVDGPNYAAERGVLVASKAGREVCRVNAERRFFPAADQTTTEVGLCFQGLSDLYLVFGERRGQPDGTPTWLVRASWNPWARLIFLGPLLMALGGALSLSDRRLRIAAPSRARRSAPAAAAEQAA